MYNTYFNLLTETFATADIHLDLHFTYCLKAKKLTRGRPTGGILIGITKRINEKDQLLRETSIVLAIELSVCVLVTVYFKPDTDVTEIFAELLPVITACTNRKINLGGDFICRLDNNSQRGQDFVDNLSHLGLRVLISHYAPTYKCHNGQNTIDLIFVNFNFNQSTLEIMKNLPSKHSVVRPETRLDDIKFLDQKLDRIYKTDTALLTTNMQDNIYSKVPEDFSIDDPTTAFISVCKYSAIKQREKISNLGLNKMHGSYHVKRTERRLKNPLSISIVRENLRK